MAVEIIRALAMNRISGRIFTGIVLLLLLAVCRAEEPAFDSLRVAHAGGGINGKAYTNSYEALDLNIKRGFQYFEIDFSFTKDNQLVCIHDWEGSFKRSFGFEVNERPTLETFKFLARNASEYRKCTLDGLATWMLNNPSATLVTDAKENNIEALRIIMEKIPDAGRRVIPQVYQPINYSTIKDMGFESMIWTLYRFKGTDAHVKNWTRKFTGPFAVTMPEERARTELPVQLKDRHIPTYVHTINDQGVLDMYRDKYGLTEVYTDTLPPGDMQ